MKTHLLKTATAALILLSLNVNAQNSICMMNPNITDVTIASTTEVIFTNSFTKEPIKPMLLKCSVNETGEKTTFSYLIPSDADNALIEFYNNAGLLIGMCPLEEGSTEVSVLTKGWAEGDYSYSLVFGENVLDTKTFSISR